ncbi:MAG: hypothetical protein FGM44_12690, partial [Limnohabitans sp.]|nr:hypothetical protein [Limnohabitans sp.]
ISAAPGGVQLPDSAPLPYVLDTLKPDAPSVSLVTDTSNGKNITQIPLLKPIAYDANELRLEYQIKKNGSIIQAFSERVPQLLTDGSQDGTYSIAARLVDKAGNVSQVDISTALGTGTGYVNFVLDTLRPATLSAPSLKEDTTNGLTGFARDNITSNFRLADEQPTIESGAQLQYSVQRAGQTTDWLPTYLDAMGAANGLNGDKLTNWKNLSSSTDQAAQLIEGLYSVKRRQIDAAGNISLDSSALSFTLDTQITPLVVALENDTSKGKSDSSDVRIKLSGVEGTPGVEAKVVYELTRYTDALHTNKAAEGTVTTTNTYTPPTKEGFYTLKVTQTNKAGLSNASELKFQLDSTASPAPDALGIEKSADSTRGTKDDVGVNDGRSNVTVPTFNVKLATGSNAPQLGDRLELYRDGDLTKPWGVKVLDSTDLAANVVKISANTLAPADGQPIGSTDGVYTFKARWVDVAGNASAMSPALTYTLDTVAQAPTIQPIQLEGLPQNLINRQDKVVFSGTGEAGSMLTLRWDNLTYSVEVSSAGTWRLELQRTDDPTTSQFPADTARLGFTSNVTVTLIDPAGNASASSTLMLALNTATVQTLATVTSVTDSNRMGSGLASVSAPGYSVNPTGEVAKGATTDEHLPIITGTLNQALPDALRADGSDRPIVRVYDGNVLLGLATVTGTQWTFAVTTPLANGVHNFSADVYDPLTLQTGARGSAYSISSNMLTLQPLDAAHPAEWIIQNTATPTLGGELKAALATGESLVVYDRQSDGSFTRLGVVSSFNTTANGVTWSFDMPRPMFGAHVYRVQVENAAGVGLMALDQSVRYDFNSVLLKAGSDTGLSPDDGISNIKTPTVQVRFASQTQVGAVVKILLDGQPLTGATYQRAVTAADLGAGVMEFTLPDLWARTGNAGLPLKDRTTRISAMVGDLSVVSDVYYQLDTAAPTLVPNVAVQTLTGGSTGYTSNKTLKDLTTYSTNDTQDYVQVQVVDTATSNVLRDWVSLESFNAAPLADGNYTVRNRMVDKAGNIGAKLGTDVNLRYDTQAAQVLSVQAVSSADATVAYQQDAYLNKLETAASATFQFKLTFNEKIKGLTKELLSLKTSLGAGALAPTLDSVNAVSADAQGFTAEWLVTVSQLDRLSEDGTLQLILSNGSGLLDQAGNAGTLAYTSSPVMRVDRTASLNLTDLLSGTRSLLSGDSSLVLFNGAAVSTGVMVKGKVLGVEAGRLVTVTIKDDKGASIYTTDGAAVAADGTWSINLTPGTQALGLLQDKGNYTLTASVTDQAGNLAQATLNVAARLTASIDINTVLASSSGQTVLSYATSSLDDAVTADDKTAGVSGGAQGGFSVRGVTSLEAGRVVTVALMQVGSSVQVLGSGGVVAANGAWEVRFTSTQVGNLTDGRWVLVASGQDASGNEARNDERSRIFTVDTRATVNMNVVSDDARINLSQDGATLAVSGSFTDIESDRTLTLKLRDRNADDPSKVVWESTGVTLGSNGQWATNITLAQWDALSLGKDANGVSQLMLSASATDKAGNLAEYTTSISLDRSPPAVPNVGDAVRQIAGDTLINASTQSQSRSLTLADTSTGVRLAPNAVGPTVTDVVTIVVEGTSVQSAADQWRLGGTLVGMNASTPETAATLGTGSDTIAFTYSFDANTRQLSIKAVGGAFSPTQVQALLRDLSWVNTQSDVALSQVDRVFKVRYVDAFQNLSDQATITFQVDTLKPTTLSDITIIPAGGTVTANTLNATNTGMGLKATIGAGQA